MIRYVYLSILFITIPALAQSPTDNSNSPKELYEQLLALDEAVFSAFNSCDSDKFKSYFTEDSEFYHDRGGVMITDVNITESFRKGICSNPDIRVRRERVKESVQVYRMDNYGGIIIGEHLFYETIDGKEKLNGRARFTHLCRFKDGRWKIHRVLSYDHRAIE